VWHVAPGRAGAHDPPQPYSTDAFFRHQLKEDFAEADLEQRIYRNFDEARKSLRVRDL
jgi:hypothetical protein